MKQTLIEGLPTLGLSLSAEQIDRLCRFGAQMLAQNQVMNLTAITEPGAVAQLHFLDSKPSLTSAAGRDFPGCPWPSRRPGAA